MVDLVGGSGERIDQTDRGREQENVDKSCLVGLTKTTLYLLSIHSQERV